MAQLYPSFAKGLAPFFTINWNEYSDFLTFQGGLNPVTGGLWLSDQAHHHLAIAVLFLVAGHQYRTNWDNWSQHQRDLRSSQGSLYRRGHKGLYEITNGPLGMPQLAINLALFGSLSIIVAHHTCIRCLRTHTWQPITEHSSPSLRITLGLVGSVL